MDLWYPVPAVAAKGTELWDKLSFQCLDVCFVFMYHSTKNGDWGINQHLHEQVPDKNNKIHSLTIQVFTARLPGVGTILGSGSTMVTMTEKGPSRMELAFQWGRAEGKQMINQMIADYANEPADSCEGNRVMLL